MAGPPSSVPGSTRTATAGSSSVLMATTPRRVDQRDLSGAVAEAPRRLFELARARFVAGRRAAGLPPTRPEPALAGGGPPAGAVRAAAAVTVAVAACSAATWAGVSAWPAASAWRRVTASRSACSSRGLRAGRVRTDDVRDAGTAASPGVSSCRGRIRLRMQRSVDLVSTCRGGALKACYPPLTPPGEGESGRRTAQLTPRGEESGGPPGAVPEDQRDAELATVLRGDDELELGDPHRWTVTAGLEQLPGRQGHRGDDEDVVGRRLGHARSS